MGGSCRGWFSNRADKDVNRSTTYEIRRCCVVQTKDRAISRSYSYRIDPKNEQTNCQISGVIAPLKNRPLYPITLQAPTATLAQFA